MQVLAPEEIELNKKRRVLERLKEKLAASEEQMTELRAELKQFEAQYTMEVGRLYAALDEIEAQIAEEEVKLVPDDEEIKRRAEELRRRAERRMFAAHQFAASSCLSNLRRIRNDKSHQDVDALRISYASFSTRRN